jgi:iron complex transport system substrate-binding protein
MKKLTMIFMISVLTVVLAACGAGGGGDSAGGNGGAAQPPEAGSASGNGAAEEEVLTIRHQLGEAQVKKNPQKVVVFDFGVLDTLDKLGVEVAALPKKNIPSYLSKYEDEKYKNVGTLQEPDFEAINALAPDLIIISGRTSEAYEELNKIAPTIYMAIDTARFMDSFKENMRTLGQIFGKEDAVEAELAKIEQRIAEVNAAVKDNGKKALVVLTTGGKVSAYGPGSRFGMVHDVIGLAPADENIEVSTHGQNISFEYIAEKNPDYLIVIDRDAVVQNAEGAVPAKEVIENDLVKNTKAYQNGGIIYVNPEYWYLSGGGLVSVAQMVEEVAAGVLK